MFDYTSRPKNSKLTGQPGSANADSDEQVDWNAHTLSDDELPDDVADQVRNAAARCCSLGLSVIPLLAKSKVPAGSWREFQTRRATAEECAHWFAGNRHQIAIVLGPVSGDLYVRDFDDAGAYHAWAAEHADLARSMPTVESARGFHVYGRWPGVSTVHGPDGELRGAGSYIVAPPSLHPSGRRYSWQVSPADVGDFPSVDPVAAGLVPNQKSASAHNGNAAQQPASPPSKINWSSVPTESVRFLKFGAEGREPLAALRQAAADLRAAGADWSYAEEKLSTGAEKCGLTVEQVREALAHVYGLPQQSSVSTPPPPAVPHGASVRTRNFLAGQTPEGTRNNELFTAACDLVGNGLDPDQVRGILAPAARQCGLADAEIDSTIASACSRPRSPSKNPPTVGGGATLAVAIERPRPKVCLPGNAERITDAAQTLGGLLAATGNYFCRGAKPVTVSTTPALRFDLLEPAAAATHFEQVATLVRRNANGDENACICSKTTADLLVHSPALLAQLPVVRVLSPCPVITEDAEELVVVQGFHPASAIFATGAGVPELSVDQAKDLLDLLLADFQFASRGDRSRAMAAIITPALVHGGLLGGRAPLDVSEADDSQAGKGFRNRLTAAIYARRLRVITQKTGRGVGSIEESLSTALISGADLISFDNFRGKLDCPALESMLTESTYLARAAYERNIEVATDRIVIQLTSNQAEMTRDLANRSSFVNILKQPPGYQFQQFAQGDILDFVQANQPFFLGAVFAVIRAWHAAGKPQTQETRHDFRAWARKLGWIVENLLGCAPLLDGHQEARQRVVTPQLAWLRQVALAVRNAGRCGDSLRTHEIVDIIVQDPAVETPGLGDGDDPDDDAVRRKMFQACGRKLTAIFKQRSTVAMEGLTVTQKPVHDFSQGRPMNTYTVSIADPAAGSGNAGRPPVP